MSTEDKHSKDPFHPHVMPLWVYFGVYFALLVLTAVTVGVTKLPTHAIFGEMTHTVDVIIAMAVATVKATLVLLIFMHLLFDNKLYSLLFSGCMFFVVLFITFSMLDTHSRGFVDEIREYTISAEGKRTGMKDWRKNAEAYEAEHGGEKKAHAEAEMIVEGTEESSVTGKDAEKILADEVKSEEGEKPSDKTQETKPAK
ncbi:MAG: cytochrome C oxidase subunit IV family protein [Lentisphaeria bacterium]|nr:cytochrome C oxidase subunit IV family protein [Lentisphaeria bacterium]